MQALTLIKEAMAVLALGIVAALAANALSPRGLRLNRDYFNKSAITNSAAVPLIASVRTNATRTVADRLRDAGLNPIAHDRVVQLHQDSGRQSGLIVFIDARNEELYLNGHIPGAWQFDYYHPESTLGGVLALCATATNVVVYCHGGDCEDSALSSQFLMQAGVPAPRLQVYYEGFERWTNSGMSMETGPAGAHEGAVQNP
jgi:rhodanese-related sulfurtransferase